MTIEIRLANYHSEQDGEAVVKLLNDYALDGMGGGTALSEYTQQNLTQSLANVPHAFTVLAFVDGKPAGLINCFEGFSTFKCKPLVNIHDISVSPDFRGLGLSNKMIDCVEQEAKKRNACKLTLEVLESNQVAQNAYKKSGFSGYELDPKMGKAMFWENHSRKKVILVNLILINFQ